MPASHSLFINTLPVTYTVQGEDMETRKIRIKREREFPAGILLCGGFLLGVLLPNIIWKLQWRQDTVASLYLLYQFADRNVSGWEYFLEVLRMRGGYVLLCVLCGFSVFGVPLAFLGMLMTGVEIGALLAVSVLQFGLAGGAVGLGLLFPQYLLYLPFYVYLMELVYQQSRDIWKNRGIFPEHVSGYLGRALVILLAFLGGILLETFINPFVVEKLMQNINFF